MPDSPKPITQHLDEIHLNRRSWAAKPLLRRVYGAFYQRIAAHLPAPDLGPVLELGSGIGHAKAFIPGCITSDLFPNPGIDRVENAYRINFPDASLGAVVLIDVWHHLEFPATAAQELHRVLKPGGRLLLLEPAAGWLGRCIYGLFHHEPLGLRQPIKWRAPPSFDPDQHVYYAAQGNGWRMFSDGSLPDQLPGWRLQGLELMSALTYVASGGLSKAQLYPESLYPALRRVERLLDRAPRLFSTRMLVCLEKNAANVAPSHA